MLILLNQYRTSKPVQALVPGVWGPLIDQFFQAGADGHWHASTDSLYQACRSVFSFQILASREKHCRSCGRGFRCCCKFAAVAHGYMQHRSFSLRPCARITACRGARLQRSRRWPLVGLQRCDAGLIRLLFLGLHFMQDITSSAVL